MYDYGFTEGLDLVVAVEFTAWYVSCGEGFGVGTVSYDDIVASSGYRCYEKMTSSSTALLFEHRKHGSVPCAEVYSLMFGRALAPDRTSWVEIHT